MKNDDVHELWSIASLVALEQSLWQNDPFASPKTDWLYASWQNPAFFWKGLHTYWKRQRAAQTKSMVLSCYDLYNDLILSQKNKTLAAYICFDGTAWQTYSYADLEIAANHLAAAWEKCGVQAGETLVILHPQGFDWLIALLAGLRLGLIVSLLPPQGPAFVQRRLENLSPTWLVMNQLYRHRLAASWEKIILPHTASPLLPTRQPYLYSASEVVAQCFDPTSLTPDLPYPIDADRLYLSALRDGIFSLGIKPGQLCAAPDWHTMESQPALVLAVLLSGATWVHIELADIEKKPERLLEQPMTILGISRSLRDVLQQNLSPLEKPWRYWFRHPAESSDLTVWQDFVKKLQLQDSYCGNLLWNSRLGGAIFFSIKYRGFPHHQTIPAAGLCWQFGMVESPDLPCLDDSGRIAIGKEEKNDIVWTASPHLVALYLKKWHYLGNYPRGRAARTYPREEVLAVLVSYNLPLALIEVSRFGSDADPKQILLAFGENIDTTLLEKRIETELGKEFLPDRVEVLHLLPQHNDKGEVDQEWCQSHYLTGELYRRQRNNIYQQLFTLKKNILAATPVNG